MAFGRDWKDYRWHLTIFLDKMAPQRLPLPVADGLRLGHVVGCSGALQTG